MTTTDKRPFLFEPVTPTKRALRTVDYFRAADRSITEERATTGTVSRVGPLVNRRRAPQPAPKAPKAVTTYRGSRDKDLQAAIDETVAWAARLGVSLD